MFKKQKTIFSLVICLALFFAVFAVLFFGAVFETEKAQAQSPWTETCSWVFYKTVYYCASGSGTCYAGSCSFSGCKGQGGVYGHADYQTCTGSQHCHNGGWSHPASYYLCHYVNGWGCSGGSAYPAGWGVVSGGGCSNVPQPYCPPPCSPVNASLSGWSGCSAACGGGTQTRTCSGASCGGSATCGGAALSQSCNIQSCTVNGACGSANGGTFATAPTTNLCSAGTATPIPVTSNPATWNWNCNGSSGGNIVSCSANKPAPTPGGVNPIYDNASVRSSLDFNTINDLCIKPSVSNSDTNLVLNGNDWTWTCPGSNGSTVDDYGIAHRCVATDPVFTECTFSCGGGTRTGTYTDAECQTNQPVPTGPQVCNSQPCTGEGYREVAP